MEKKLDITNPRYNEVIGITNDIFHLSNSVMYGKEPRYNEPISPVPWHFVKSRFRFITNPRYNEPISPVPWHFVKSRFHCV